MLCENYHLHINNLTFWLKLTANNGISVVFTNNTILAVVVEIIIIPADLGNV